MWMIEAKYAVNQLSPVFNDISVYSMIEKQKQHVNTGTND